MCCSAPLLSRTRRSAPFPHAALDGYLPSPTRCGARLPSPGFGVRLPASHGGTVAGPARHAATYESQRSATAPVRRGARPLPPCPIAQPLLSHCLWRTSYADEPPFPKQQGDVCDEMPVSVSSVSNVLEVRCKRIVQMLQK
jgi:hypothetical protein